MSLSVATFVGLLPICSMLAAKRRGQEIHGRILRQGFERDTPIGNALIEMYSKCGSLDSSIRVFNCLKDRDLVSWTSLISSYGTSGLGRKALETFAEMQTNGINPDHVALVATLDSCGLEPLFEYYCIVDLLSRSGQFAKAEEFIESMPVKANTTVWGALLSACREMGDVEVAERVSRRIAELGSDDPVYHVLASHVMDESMKRFQQDLVELETEAEDLLLARTKLVDIDRLRNGNREALTALRRKARTTRSSVPSPFESLMKDIGGYGSRPLVQEVCATCGEHDPGESTWMLFSGADIFASVPFHAAHTVLEEEQSRLEFEAKRLQSYVKEKSFGISEKGALADKISPGVLRSLVALKDNLK